MPDFTEIDLFKEEIYKTLEDYVTRIDRMKEEMEELSTSAEAIENVILYSFYLLFICYCCLGVDSSNYKRIWNEITSKM